MFTPIFERIDNYFTTARKQRLAKLAVIVGWSVFCGAVGMSILKFGGFCG